METLARDGYEIAFATKGTGPDLLFIHNGGTSSTIWRHQVDDLSARYRTIAVDLPGFGSAARHGTAAKWHAQVNLLVAVLDKLDVKSTVVIGNCMGSNLAAGIADARPHVVRALVLINPLTEKTLRAGGLGKLRSASSLVPWTQRVARRFVPPKLAAVELLRFQLGAKGIAKGLHHDERLLATTQRRDQLPALIDISDDISAYAHLDQPRSRPLPPICTVWGEQNKALSARAGRRLNDVLRPERAEYLADCGHLPMLEDPSRVTAIIDEFARIHLEGTQRSASATDSRRDPATAHR